MASVDAGSEASEIRSLRISVRRGVLSMLAPMGPFESLRYNAVIECPERNNLRAMWEPQNPVIPVRNTFIGE
jgi:hypothetical protein